MSKKTRLKKVRVGELKVGMIFSLNNFYYLIVDLKTDNTSYYGKKNFTNIHWFKISDNSRNLPNFPWSISSDESILILND